MAPSPPLPSLPQAPGSQPAKGRLLILRLSRYNDYPPSLRLIQKISKWRFQRTSKFQNFLSSSSPSKRATSSRFLSRNLARVPTHACVSPSIREKARTWTWRLSRRRGRRRSRWCWPIAGVGAVVSRGEDDLWACEGWREGSQVGRRSNLFFQSSTRSSLSPLPSLSLPSSGVSMQCFQLAYLRDASKISLISAPQIWDRVLILGSWVEVVGAACKRMEGVRGWRRIFGIAWVFFFFFFLPSKRGGSFIRLAIKWTDRWKGWLIDDAHRLKSCRIFYRNWLWITNWFSIRSPLIELLTWKISLSCCQDIVYRDEIKLRAEWKQILGIDK